MRAVRRLNTQVTLERSAPEPNAPPAPGWAIVRPTRVGINAADLAPSPESEQAVTLGSEFVGVVERIEPDPKSGLSEAAAKKWKGKRVVGDARVPCGECELCTRGLSKHCRAAKVLGQTLDGCFADAFAVPLANLVELPKSVDDDAGVCALTLADALHTASQVRVEGKPFITVLGDNQMGLLCAQVMARLNASVRVVGTHERNLSLCEKWGVKHRPLNEVGRRADQDIVVECTGTAEGLNDALRMVRPRGVVLLKARPAQGGPIDLGPILDGELHLNGSRGGSVAEAVDRLAKGDIDCASLITRRMKLDDGVNALRVASEPDQIKVVMDI
jgi:threonine dehydrogenase-like Zn-dependent dehydrogenase